MTYQPLPKPPARRDTDDIRTRGYAILTFVISTGVTATIDTADLYCADHAGLSAVSGLQRDAGATLATIQYARDLVGSALRRRLAEGSTKPAVVDTYVAIPTMPADNGGTSRVPVPTSPKPLAPTGSLAPLVW